MVAREVRVVLEIGANLSCALATIQAAAEAHPMREDETPAEFVRRIIAAAHWVPDGWSESPEAPSLASDEED